MKKINIAIDGYSGTGKSSTAKRVSEHLDYVYIDSGAMYRAVTYYFLENNVSLSDQLLIEKALRKIDIEFRSGKTFLNGRNVDREIRSMVVNQQVSQVSTLSLVRTKLVEMQRNIGERKGVVMDGRDIGTVVFPNAELKLFMTAEMDVRVERRRLQLSKKGINESFDDIKQNFIKRDEIDTTRNDSPLKKAKDAVEIDTTQLALEDQILKIVEMAKKVIMQNGF